MESKELDLQVGDRVKYKIIRTNEILTLIVDRDSLLDDLKRGNFIEVLKIERPKYEVVEEKKELLTEEEKEFLKMLNKVRIDGIDKIERQDNSVIELRISGKQKTTVNFIPTNKFKNLELGKIYNFSELELD